MRPICQAVAHGSHFPRFSDAALAALAAECTELEEIDLSETSVSPRGLSALLGLRKLQALRVDASQCTDEGLKHLSRITSNITLESFGIRKLETLDKRQMDSVKAMLVRYSF